MQLTAITTPNIKLNDLYALITISNKIINNRIPME
jgi:hypothetical protein